MRTPRLTPEMVACAEALGLGHSTVSMRLSRGWSPWEAVSTPQRLRSQSGSRQRRLRYGMPRHWGELVATFNRKRRHQLDVQEARNWLRLSGLLPEDVAVALSVDRPRRSPLRLARSTAWQLYTEEYHRDP